MAASKKATGYMSQRVARNLPALRRERGLSTYALSEKLADIGWSLHPTALTRIEAGERRVDVDDLAALAVALDVSMNRLLLPTDVISIVPPDGEGAPYVASVVPLPDQYVVTSETRAEWADMWRWATGEHWLILRDEEGKPLPQERSDRDEALWYMENLPHKYQDVYAAIVRERRERGAAGGAR